LQISGFVSDFGLNQVDLLDCVFEFLLTDGLFLAPLGRYVFDGGLLQLLHVGFEFGHFGTFPHLQLPHNLVLRSALLGRSPADLACSPHGRDAG
jgi:hypothetical protein